MYFLFSQEKDKGNQGAVAPKRPPLKRPEPNRDAEISADNPLNQPGKKQTVAAAKSQQQQQQKREQNANKARDNAKSNPPKDQGKKKPESESKTHGTLKPAKNFNVDEDVRKIHEAMKGFGTDEEPLIRILTGRSNEQRQQIKKRYHDKYKSVSVAHNSKE